MDNLEMVNEIKRLIEQDIKWDKLNNTTVLITGIENELGQYIVNTFKFLNTFIDKKINIIEISKDNLLTEKIILRCDYFIHAEISTPYNTDDELFNYNIIGIISTLGFLKGKKHNLKNFVYFTVDDEYTKYGYYKQIGAKLCLNYNVKNNLPVSIIKIDDIDKPNLSQIFEEILED